MFLLQMKKFTVLNKIKAISFKMEKVYIFFSIKTLGHHVLGNQLKRESFRESLKSRYKVIVEPYFRYCCSFWSCTGSIEITQLQKH